MLRTAISLIFPFLLVACDQASGPLEISGRIEVDDIHVGSRVGGRVWRVHYEEGEAVPAGEAIVELEGDELRAQRDAALAARAEAQSRLDLLLAGTRKEELARAEAVVWVQRAELALRREGFRAEEVRGAEAELAAAQSGLELARKELERAQSLFATKNIPQQELDAKRTAYETASAKLDVARERAALYRSGSRPEEIAIAEARLAEAEAQLAELRDGPRPEEIAAARAAVEAASANVARLGVQLAETRILAPEDAVVDTLDLEPGDLVRAGETVAVLNLRHAPWVRCYLPEDRLGWVRPGDGVDVTVDSFPERTFRGTVRRVSSRAEFTPRNVQTPEKRSELVFEMKIDVTEGGEDLRAGMYADVLIARADAP